MLLHGQLVKKNVMLWADANDLLNELDVLDQLLRGVSVVDQVFAKTRNETARCFHHACQHRDRGGLACSVVTKQGENLGLVQGK